MAFQLTHDEVLGDLKEKYPNYDYSKFKYTKMREKVIIICKKHGEFFPTCSNFKKGSGCPECSKKIIRNYGNNSTKKLTQVEIIKRFKKVHKDKYDYSKVDYINSSTKVEIICPEHGSFFQIPASHIRKHGCPKCSILKRSILRISNSYNTQSLIKKFKDVHGNKYDYSEVKYINTNSKVEIICSKHGSFFQNIYSHFNGVGCPKCNSSKGEEKIRLYLEKYKINYIEQYRFNNCKNINPLPFDFYLPELNILIEFDGKQHFKPIFHFGGKKEFLKIQKRDKIKTEFVKKNNIKLIRIPYSKYSEIEKILFGVIQT